MSEKPILFSGEMVRAILDGRKTQTRRIIKPQPKYLIGDERRRLNIKHNPGLKDLFLRISKYGQLGDRLWVRETWKYWRIDGGLVIYKADKHDDVKANAKWKPSIHMPRLASRITLEILNVRVERLNDISEQEALAEGVRRYGEEPIAKYGIEYPLMLTAKNAFAWLWESINGPDSWELNPWVWVIEFKRVKP